MLKYNESWGIIDAFSRNHNYPYTAIGIQELNLAYHYPIEYWNCAVLAVNSGALELDEDKNKGKDYGKLANALGDMKSHGVEVNLPDINKSDFSFAVDKETNNILFGLKGISKINDSNCIDIIKNRPYNSLKDFYERMKDKLEAGRIVSLIKAGCFDTLENKDRLDIMKDFIDMITPKKSSLTSSILPTLIDLKLIPTNLALEGRYVKFKKYILDKKFFVRNDDRSKTKKYYLIEPTVSQPFFVEHFIDMLVEEEDYIYNENGNILLLDKNFDKIYKIKTKNIHQWVKSQEALDIANKLTFNDNWDKYVKSSSIAKWEMESVSFYHNEHELIEANINLTAYGVVDFNTLNEKPTIIKEKQKNDRTFYEYETSVIAGTVIHRDKGRHIVSLLTPTGVVKVKFYKGNFSFYDKTISKIDSNGKKARLETGWFSRGTQLLIKGYRQDDQFRPKTYDGSHSVFKIEGYQDNGLLWLREDRVEEK